MRHVALLSILFALAACGADGEPERPDRTDTGLNVSGTVSIGATGSL